MEPSGFVDRPDYRVDIMARRNRVTVSIGDDVLADSERCLLVDEQDHGLVFYFPPEDVRLDLFVPDETDDPVSVQGHRHLSQVRRTRGRCAHLDVRRALSRGGATGRLRGLLSGCRRGPGRCGQPCGFRAMSDHRPMVTEASSLSRMLDIFDVEPIGDSQFTGVSDGGGRRVVDGSQLLAQAIVACSKTFPNHTARSAHAVFLRVVDDERPLQFNVDVIHEGRTFAGAVVSILQGGPRCASVTVLMDVEQPDVIQTRGGQAAGGVAHGSHPVPDAHGGS